MGIVRIFARIQSGRPCLEFRNDRNEKVAIQQINFLRGDAVFQGVEVGRGTFYLPATPLQIEPGQSLQICGEQVDHPSGESLNSKLGSLLSPDERETVIRIGVDLHPRQADHDQPPPSFYVIRTENGQIIEFFPLLGSLKGQTSLLDALLESRRHGA